MTTAVCVEARRLLIPQQKVNGFRVRAMRTYMIGGIAAIVSSACFLVEVGVVGGSCLRLLKRC